MTQKSWCVVYVKSRHEKKAGKDLQNMNIETYLPIVKQLSVWSDRKKWVEKPLFSGYLFVRPSKSERDKVLEIHGIVSYLRFNGKDAEVKEKEIQLIRSLLQFGYDIHDDTTFSLSFGDKVEVKEGPLKGQKGEVIKIDDKEYFTINFESFNQSIRVNLPKQILKKIA